MKAIILVGGEGTRLRPLTCNTPKPMVPILNRPFLEHVLHRLRGFAVEEVILALCYLPNRIQEYFGTGGGTGVALSYVQEEEPLGTAGAVKNVERHLDGTFFVLNGDIFTDLDFLGMLAFHREKGAKATIFLTPVEDPTAFGVVETDASGRVLRFREKPRPEEVNTLWINGGVYVLEPQVLDLVPQDTFYMFERGLFPRLVGMGYPVYGYRARPYWMDVGTPASYLKVHRDLLLGSTAVPFLGGDAPDRVWLGQECSVDSSATLRGPILLGDGCRIEAGVVVAGPTVLGPGCVLGRDSQVTGSVMWQGARVGKRTTLTGCILGSDVNVEDEATIDQGCVVGDSVWVGQGNRLERGIALWPDTRLAPHSVSFLDG